MNPLSWLKIIFAVLLVACGYTAYIFYEKYSVAKVELVETQKELLRLAEAKAKSEQAALALQEKMNELAMQKDKVVTKLVQIPVSPDEKCMSTVLKEALK